MKLKGPLAQLDEHQFAGMLGLIAMGKGDTDVARAMIKNGWITGSSERATMEAVRKWRKGGGQDLAVRMVAEMMTTQRGTIRKQTEVLFEMTDLIEKQKGRLDKLLKVEGEQNKHLTTTTDEMKTLFTMLAQLGKLQLDSGIIRRVPVGKMSDDYAELEDAEYEDVHDLSEEDRAILLIAARELGITDD